MVLLQGCIDMVMTGGCPGIENLLGLGSKVIPHPMWL